MSETLGVVIMMNNYFHDVATALLMGSGVALFMMLRHHELGASEASDDFFLRIHRSMSRLAKFAIGWIVLGGIPRTIYYERFEWNHWAGKSQIPALMVKHDISRLPVVENGQVVGIITRSDTLRHLYDVPVEGDAD